MMHPVGHNLAEFNYGVLRHPFDDPRIADFTDGLDRVNAIAARSDGFVWRLPDAEMEAAQLDPDGVFGGNPQVASTLSVWRDADSLNRFVWQTVHAQFYARKDEWFSTEDSGNLVLWWVPEGARPTVADGMERLRHWRANGDTEFAFGWSHLGVAPDRPAKCLQGAA